MAFQLENIQQTNKTSKSKVDIDRLLKKEIKLFGTSLNSKTKENFYTELSVLLKAGINLKSALELLESSTKKKQHKSIINGLSKALVSGDSLSEAIYSSKQFSNYEYYSVKIGEETGTLAKVSYQLGGFFERKNEQRRNLVSALTYPVIILFTALLVVVFMLTYVVPMFQDIFQQQNVELPGITKLIIGLSVGLKTYGIYFLMTTVLLVVFRFAFNKKFWFRKYRDLFIAKIPFFGHFTRTVYLAQFTQAVSLLISSKVPVLHSIELVKKMIGFFPLQSALKDVEQDILQGKSLSHSLKQHDIFDDKMVALVKVSEETNQTEFIFERLNKQYDTQVQQQSKMLSTIMEPIIILVVGIFVGIILIAMYLPMFKLSSVMG